jgi:type VI secretion system FHA domain protein
MPLILTLSQTFGGQSPVNQFPGGEPQTRTLDQGSLTIGRAPGNGWVLPDPLRHLSRTHCVIAAVDGGYVLTDLSVNGVFLNDSTEPLSADRHAMLADGDRIRLGDHVITVSETAATPAAAPPTARQAADTLSDLFATGAGFVHPVAAAPAVRLDDPFDRADEMAASAHASVVEDLFKGFEPLEAWKGPSQPDDADAPAHAMAEPRVTAPPRLDELDIDALLGDVPPGHPAPAPLPISVAVLEQVAAPPATAAPVAAMAPPAPLPASAAEAGPLLAAFLDGAGVAGMGLETGADPRAALHAAGELLRAMVEGLREVLMSRAAVKHEFRAEQTMLGPADNNPLKFSITPEDAVAALLRPGRRGYQKPLDATREAFADLKSHELAVMAGVQTALTGLLRRLDPAALEQRQTAGLLPVARKARCWEQYRTTYATIARAAEDDFQSAFGRDFARAYEAQARAL